MSGPTSPPVVFVIFNRPDLTETTFDVIRRAKPPVLLVVADGARADRPGEAEKCREARSVLDRVDWECELLTNFSDANMGCKLRVSTGITWAFQNVDSAIILEDDCLPDDTFFPFCLEMLDRYKDDPRVMSISGCNFNRFGRRSGPSYAFSKYSCIWGWATWKRAWEGYDASIPYWPELRKGERLAEILRDRHAEKFFRGVLDEIYGGDGNKSMSGHSGKLDTWDFQWVFKCIKEHGLSISPSTNLISNLGMRNDATHTNGFLPAVSCLPVKAMEFPLNHPSLVVTDAHVDAAVESALYFTRGQASKWKRRANIVFRTIELLLFSSPSRRRSS